MFQSLPLRDTVEGEMTFLGKDCGDQTGMDLGHKLGTQPVGWSCLLLLRAVPVVGSFCLNPRFLSHCPSCPCWGLGERKKVPVC